MVRRPPSHFLLRIVNLLTALSADPHRPGRFEVEIDGRAAGRVSIDAIERLALQVGRPLDARQEAELPLEMERAATYDRAVGMLAAGARAGADLRRVLLRKGEPPHAVDHAIERLTAAGYLDDAAFARQFARAKMLGARLSRRRLESELRRRGVDRGVASEAIAAVIAEEQVDEGAMVEEAARKKLRTLASLDRPTRRRRLYAYLARRGYDLDEIRRVLERLE